MKLVGKGLKFSAQALSIVTIGLYTLKFKEWKWNVGVWAELLQLRGGAQIVVVKELNIQFPRRELLHRLNFCFLLKMVRFLSKIPAEYINERTTVSSQILCS
jgi:hypothetical protein